MPPQVAENGDLENVIVYGQLYNLVYSLKVENVLFLIYSFYLLINYA